MALSESFAEAGPAARTAWWRRQFGQPSGTVGRLCGRLMAVANREINRLAVDLLEVRREDRVLEVGCGPGANLGRLAELASAGLVAAVDPSEAMRREARKRSFGYLRAGRVEVRSGSVSHLPYRSESFDKVLTVNTVYLWPRPAEDALELRRVLKPGGRLLVAFRGAPVDGERRRGGASVLSDEDVARLVALLEGAGFADVTVEAREARSRRDVCVLGSR